MGAADLLQHLRTTGFSVTAAGDGGIRVVPAGVLSADQRQAIRDNKLALLGLDVAPGTPETLATLIQVETVKWAKVVKESGAKLD